MTDDCLIEHQLLAGWAHLPRHPLQRNRMHDTDAELVSLGNGTLLAITVDQVVEEIRTGLYREPETIGRIGVLSALADLAAVGADPLGVLIAATLPSQQATEIQAGLARGIADACLSAQTFVLGGDTNIGSHVSLAVTAVGTVREGHALTRCGAKPADEIWASGRLGDGAALGAVRLLGLPAALMSENDYRPRSHFALARTLRGIARTCMDTSDGLLATLDEISRRSGVRVSLDVEPTALLTDRAARVQQALSVPALAFLGAIHGEFELVFALDATARSRLPPDTLQRCMRLGVVRDGSGVDVLGRVVDTMAIRNLGAQQPLDARKYLASLVDLCR